MSARFLVRAVAVLALVLAVAGCDSIFGRPSSPFKGVDITSSDVGGELRLVDHHGTPRTLADFRGKVVVVFFGYTQCADVCPTTLADLASALKRLGGDARDVQVLFVTVDPRRDTARLLEQYVTAFNPTFLGLTGDAAAIAKATAEFHVYSEEHPGKTPESYTVDHSAQVFALDRQGKVRLMWPYGTPPEAIGSDLRILLNS